MNLKNEEKLKKYFSFVQVKNHFAHFVSLKKYFKIFNFEFSFGEYVFYVYKRVPTSVLWSIKSQDTYPLRNTQKGLAFSPRPKLLEETRK